MRGRKRVTVVVSLGEEFSSVPELFGESMRSARLLIERAGLRVGPVMHAPSEEVGEGLVAGSDPGAETVLPRDTPVHLLVSTGPGEESFVMPDLLGREIAGVRRQLEALGFRVVMPPAAPALGTIVLQDPAPGSRITRATVILLQAAGPHDPMKEDRWRAIRSRRRSRPRASSPPTSRGSPRSWRSSIRRATGCTAT